MRWRRCARRSISAAITRVEARRTLGPRSRCRARPGKPTSFAIAVAACSSASARGIFRSRSFSARSPPRSPPAMPWWRNPPSRRRSSPPRRCGPCTRPAFPRARCICVPGDGKVGAALVADPRVAGVAFTGSTEVARSINRALAAKDGADRAADRRDRRHQSDDRRCDRAAGAGHRRCDDVGVPLRRPALLGAAAAVPAGGRGRSSSSR